MHRGSLRTGLLLFLDEMEGLHGGMPYRLLYKKVGWPGFSNKTWLEIVSRMLEDGELKLSKDAVGLTNAGKARVYGLQPARMYADKKWDGKWRMVTFEIPERKRVKRNQLRNLLSDLGFGRWQRSLYIHPYPITSFVDDYVEHLGVKKYMTSWEAKIAGTDKNKELEVLAFDQERLVEAGKKLAQNAKALKEMEGKRLENAERKWMANWQKWVFADPMLPKELVDDSLQSIKSELLERVEKMVMG